MKWLTDLLTESDGESHDIARYLAVLSILVGLGLQVYVVVFSPRPQPFDFSTFGTGVGFTFAGVAAMLKWRPESKAKE